MSINYARRFQTRKNPSGFPKGQHRKMIAQESRERQEAINAKKQKAAGASTPAAARATAR